MRIVYASKRGGKPLNIGINAAKRVARSADKRDRAHVVKVLGSGLPMQAIHHQQLVRSRHRYYHEQHDEFVRSHSSGGDEMRVSTEPACDCGVVEGSPPETGVDAK